MFDTSIITLIYWFISGEEYWLFKKLKIQRIFDDIFYENLIFLFVDDLNCIDLLLNIVSCTFNQNPCICSDENLDGLNCYPLFESSLPTKAIINFFCGQLESTLSPQSCFYHFYCHCEIQSSKLLKSCVEIAWQKFFSLFSL